MKKISYVIPCYKSRDTISGLVDDIEKVMQNELSLYDYELILVNDSSPDGTFSVIKEIVKRNNKVIGINLSKNFGQHNAIMAGLSKVTGDIIVCMDDDGQTPPSQVPKLIEALADDFDVVYGKYAEKKHSTFRNLGSIINDKMTVILLNKPKELYVSSFFAMKKYIKDEIIRYNNPYPYLGGLILRTTNKVKNVNVEHKPRVKGQSGYTIKKLLSLWVNGFTNFSTKPLRMALVISFMFMIFAAILLIVILANKLLNPVTPIGWTSTIVINLIGYSVITFLLGLIGEYVGRIYISINESPQYVIREEVKNGDKEN